MRGPPCAPDWTAWKCRTWMATRRPWPARSARQSRGRHSQLVDSCRNRPHPHQVGGKWSHQVARIRLLAEPAGIISRRENDRHSVMDIGYQLISIGGDDRKRADPLARTRLLPVLPNAGDPEWRAVLHGDGIGLLCLLSLDRFDELPIKYALGRIANRRNAARTRIANKKQFGSAA